MNLNKYNTDIVQKKKHFGAFVQLIKNQFWHGGKKYATKSGKELTDTICENHPGDSGVDWVLGTMEKYIGRYKNFGREKDLLKIATYCYILWLKAGFFEESEHDEDVSVEKED